MIALVFAIMVIVSATLVAMGVMGLLGRLPPNSVIGIRLPYTTSSDERWYTTHRYAAMPLIFGGVATTSVSLAFFPFAAAGRVSDDVAIAVIVGVAVFTVLLCVVSALVGIRAARAAES